MIGVDYDAGWTFRPRGTDGKILYQFGAYADQIRHRPPFVFAERQQHLSGLAAVALAARTKEQIDKAQQEIHAQTGSNVWAFPFHAENTERIEGLFDRIIAETDGGDK